MYVLAHSRTPYGRKPFYNLKNTYSNKTFSAIPQLKHIQPISIYFLIKTPNICICYRLIDAGGIILLIPKNLGGP